MTKMSYNLMSDAEKQNKKGMEKFRLLRDETLIQQNINPEGKGLSFAEYAQHILRNGTNEEKKEMAMASGNQLYIHNKEVCGSPIN